MNINEEFPSKYLKSADLQGRAIKVKIARVDREQIGNDSKLVMYFQGKAKGMVLNKTNARTIAEAYGDDTDNWTGGDIEVFSMKVDMQGRMVDGTRVRVVPPPRQAAPQRSPAVIPNARQAPPQQQPEPAITAGDDDPFDEMSPPPARNLSRAWRTL